MARSAGGPTSAADSPPGTGEHLFFHRGSGTSNAVEIDHVVALGNAWQTGAQLMDAGTRLRYANDPLVLLAVDGPANQQKGDGDAATWLPANKSFHLWLTPPERTPWSASLAPARSSSCRTEGQGARQLLFLAGYAVAVGVETAVCLIEGLVLCEGGYRRPGRVIHRAGQPHSMRIYGVQIGAVGEARS